MFRSIFSVPGHCAGLSRFSAYGKDPTASIGGIAGFTGSDDLARGSRKGDSRKEGEGGC